MEKPVRESNIELLKILAMVLITLSHSLPVYGGGNYLGWMNEHYAVLEWNTIMVLFLRHLGQIGNILFVISSAWFLVDNSKTKMEKIIHILLDALCISVAGLVIGLACNVEFTFTAILKMLTPTTSGLNWFVGCYLLLYSVHGYLNLIIDHAGKKGLFMLVFSMTVLYLMVCMALPDILYYSRLVCFITVYLLVGYMKRYSRPFCDDVLQNRKIFVGLAALYTLTILVYLCLACKVGMLQGRAIKFACTNNMIMIFMDLALFYFFRGVKIPYSHVINKISSVSLLFYLITENRVVAGHLRPAIFQWIYVQFGYDWLTVWILAMSIATLVLGVLVALVFSGTVSKITQRAAKAVGGVCICSFDKLYRAMTQKEGVRPE